MPMCVGLYQKVQYQQVVYQLKILTVGPTQNEKLMYKVLDIQNLAELYKKS